MTDMPSSEREVWWYVFSTLLGQGRDAFAAMHEADATVRELKHKVFRKKDPEE